MSLLVEDETNKKSEVVIEEVADFTPDQLRAIANNNNYYDLLGVGEKAKDNEISQAYRARALRVHPDKHSNSEHLELFKEAFEKLAQAKKVLLDPSTRRGYDLQRGSKVVGVFSFEALKERRKVIDADYKKINSEVVQEAQIARAKMYNEAHEANKIQILGTIMSEAKKVVLSRMKQNSWDLEETAKHATEYLSEFTTASDISKWIADSEKEEEGISRQELIDSCDLVNDKGKFTGYDSYSTFESVINTGNKTAKINEEVSQQAASYSDKASSSLLESIKAVRAAREKEQQQQMEAEEAAKRAEEEEKAADVKRLRESAMTELKKRPKIDTAEGFSRIPDAVGTKKRPPAGSVAAMLNSLAASDPTTTAPVNDDPQPTGLGLGYSSDEASD
eukprot:TRINITY_DN33674_c0_g1_i1.p1 TRINITY_DN33674_c0_g1~~TRINITY_DN33674_c0_g1_i1.p1  ORF type:complete len:412 (+),score=132.24 TRINITY_DN33674_c0_g1_i1:64-1236(+)